MLGWDQVNRKEQKTSCRWKRSRSWWDVEVRKENDKELSQMDFPPLPAPSPSPLLLFFLFSLFFALLNSFFFPHGLRLRQMCSVLTEALRHLPQGFPSELQLLPCSNKASGSVICPKIPPQPHILIVFLLFVYYAVLTISSVYIRGVNKYKYIIWTWTDNAL